MSRKKTIKMLKEDIFSHANQIKLFNQSEFWYIENQSRKIERRIMYFEEGKIGKQYKVIASIDLEDIYQDIQLVFDHKKTLIGKREYKEAALRFTGKGDVYKEIYQRLAYNQKLKMHGKIYRLNK